ncbi:glycoside hydrolase family 5 protein [Apiospora aurea]|uniref:Glycoside hydrolase family 5 protein n=1 Tax=Apiospora aurea TaxID=335848 RepID=A0ABR1PU64_9PEZI
MRWSPNLASRLAASSVLWSAASLLAAPIAVAGAANAAAAAVAPWPNGPFVTSDRWVTDKSGNIVTYAGVNWPGHIDVMIPEGLQYQSIASIVSKIKSLGMNAVRLTFAIEMIDQITHKDIPISKAFTDALGQEQGTAVLQKVLKNHQGLFDENTTRLQVFDAVAAECAKQQIYVHLDNHVSKAGWCCTPLDGNSWFGDKYFSVDNWKRGVAYMANHGKNWPNLMSIALRNELRGPILSRGKPEPYNWDTWYTRMREGADDVFKANPDLLIFLSGLDSDKNIGPVPRRLQGYGDDKLVLELHYYDILRGSEPRDCDQVGRELDNAGFSALGNASSGVAEATNRFPVLLTEFGFPQDNRTYTQTIHRCTEQFLADRQAGWTIWPLGGSYYVREGKQDFDEPWGLLTHDWSDWRSPEHIQNGLRSLIQASLAASGGRAPAAPAKDQDQDGGDGKESGGMQRRSASSMGLSIAPLGLWAAMTYGIVALGL